MRVTKAFGLILLLLAASSLAVEIGADINSVRILSVSTQIDTDNFQRVGSINGGTRLYIKIVGHDAHNAGNNSIFVGPYPCDVPEMGVNEVFITCITTPAYDNNKQWNLPVLVKVVNRSDSQCAQSDSSLCTFSYSGSKTPILDLIMPRSILPKVDVNWWGNFRITNTNQIDKMLVGNLLCDRFNLGLNEDEAYNGDSYDSLSCQIDYSHPAGFYSATFISKPGKSLNRSRLTTVRSTTLSTPYDVQIVSQQNEQGAAQSITSEGGILTINASGIPQDGANVSVTWNNADCKILSIEKTELKCELPAGLQNPTVDSNLNYESGSGAHLQIYLTSSWDLNGLITQYQTDASKLKLSEDLIVPTTEYDFESDEDGLSRKLFVFTGYFNPPRNGNYQFQTSSSYASKVYLQTTGDSTDEKTMTLINQIVEGTEIRSPYSSRFDYQQSTSDKITLSLEKGKAYYFKIYSLSSNSQSFHHSTGVRVPVPNNDSNSYVNSVSQVSRFRIDYQFTQEVISITYKDRSSAKKTYFNINFIDPFGTQIKNNAKTWTITSENYGRDTTCDQISWHFKNYNGVRSTCVQKDILDDQKVKVGSTWELTFLQHRSQIKPTFKFDSQTTDSPVFTVITPPGANLSGTFRVKVNGDYLLVNKSADIPFDIQDWDLSYALQQALGTSNIDSSRVGNFIDGAQWVFDFYGISTAISIEAIQGECKFGGETNKATLWIDTLRSASNSILYYPSIENELLTQRSAQPYAALKINGALTLASLSNQQLIVNKLTDDKAVTYSSFTDNEQTQTLTISGIAGPSSLSLQLSNFSITYNGVQCTITTSSFTDTLSCTYPYKVAGTYKPHVFYESVGFAITGYQAKNTDPFISSLSSATIYSFGGADITITGKYFPTSLDSGLIVKFGSQTATIQSVSNTQIIVRTPGNLSLGQVDVIISYQSRNSNSKQITVDNSGAITITDIDKKIISPVDKTLIKVTGTNFGTDTTKLAAFLDSVDDQGAVVSYAKYQVNIVTASGSSAQIVLGGGLPGKYQLRVVQIGKGSNNPQEANNNLEYNIYIQSFSINNASAYGGAQLVIQGINFSSTPADNQVLVNYSGNNSEFCLISDSSSTQITCTLPNMYPHFPAGKTSYDFQVQVWGKLIAQAQIQKGSNVSTVITFNTALAIPVTSLDYQYQAFSSQYTITGSNIPTQDKFKVVFLGYENVLVTINTVSSTKVTYTTPNLPFGSYNLVLRSSDGDSQPLIVNIVEKTYNLTPNTLYTVSSAGAEVTFKMSGNLPNQDPAFKFNGVYASVIANDATTGLVTVRLPPTNAASGLKLVSVRSLLIPLQKDGTLPWTNHGNTFTVVAATWQVTQITVSGSDIIIVGNGITSLTKAYLQLPTDLKTTISSTSISSKTSTGATISFSNAPAGTYKLYLLDSSNNYPSITDNQVIIPLQSLTFTQITSSFAGGQVLTITGQRFNTNNLISNVVTICGNQANVISATSSNLVVSTPPAYTSASRAAYSFIPDNNNPLTGFQTFGDDSTGNSQYISDSDLLFYYSSSNTNSCYVGLNFGSTQVVLTKFQLYPRSQGVNDASVFFGVKVQGYDGTNWVDLYTIGTDFHLGKNMYLVDTLISTAQDPAPLKAAYSQFRVFDPTAQSKCELVEIEVFGWKQSDVVENGQTLTCPVSISVNNSPSVKLSSNVVYDKTKTFVISSISPNYGDVSGGTDIQITLDRAPLSTASIYIVIDGVACKNPTLNNNILSCKTDTKTNNADSSLIVTIDNYTAVNNGILFYYGNLWSKPATWGGDFAPIDGDLVYVKDGRNLIVDIPYIGVLNTVVVENASLIFANDQTIHFEANNILVQKGRVIIGTEASPVTGNIRITMHGKQEDKQFPTVGNKGLSLYNGSIDIQGAKRPVTWTELSQTAKIGDTSIQVFIKDPGFDWKEGEEIVIASTDFAHGHAERRIITKVTKNASIVTIEFSEPLLVEHVSVNGEKYNGGQFTVNMRAEVGLLTRNIIYEGDESSTQTQYGAHLMLHGAKTSARIRYAEFRHTGQPAIIGRYPIHFHMVGDVSGSIVEGNAVHDSFARVLTIHATHYLQVKNNVGYNCAGHNIFLEDGIETNNVIQENLIIGTRQVWSMLQSDITAASYWITNPLNTVVNNRAAGGDFYGFWYEIKEHPDGPSARNDICPQGMALGQFQGNVAHSYDRFGLRIFVMTNLKYPCQPYRDDSNPNPFVDNPSFTITWKDFVSFRNHEDGVLAEEVGNMVFENFQLLDNKQSGFNVYLTNRTDEEVILRKSLIVGKSVGNPADASYLENTRGLITPRTDGFRVEDVHFANFDGSMTVFKSCSFCFHFKKWVQGGKLTRFKGISYNNINSKKIFWENWRREIYQDLDGSLSGKNAPQWITPAGPHLSNQSECNTSTDDRAQWDDGVICKQQVVRIEFSNPEKFDELYTKALYVKPCDSNGLPQGGNTDADYYTSKTVKIKNHAHDLQFGFVGTFLTGKIFSVQWELSQIDFTHFSVQLSPYHTGSKQEDTILLKFPYTDYRETWEIFQMIANKNVSPYKNVTTGQESTPLTTLKTLNCKHGDWYNDVAGRAMYLCLNDNGRPKESTLSQYLERTDVNALKCKIGCPLPPGQCLKDNIPRKLSDPSTWQNIPVDATSSDIINASGATTLVIPCPWEVLVDKDLTQFQKIIVQGNLRIDPSQPSINVQADGIWLKGGLFIAEGPTAGSPYTNKLTITLTGNRDQQTQFLVDDTIEVGNKVILNTGNFTLLGNPPTTVVARLTVPLNPGSNTITVSDVSGWNVGDRIAIAPTQLDGTENEDFTITQISGKTITLSSAAKYYHYGASGVTLSETWDSYTQQLDLRAQVVHLTRNIKITGAPVSSGIQWGCRVLNFYWQIVADKSGNALPDEQQLHMRGILNWNGVEMANCGQADTVRGALDFQKLGSDNQNKIISKVSNSAIYNCPGYCSNIEESSYINLSNNNFYNGRPILMRIYNVNNVAVSNNNFVAARKRDYPYDTSGMLYDMNAAIYFHSTQDPTVDNILINGNNIQGSEGPCAVLPHVSCDNIQNISASAGAYNNQVQTCLIGVMFKRNPNGCLWAGKVAVSRSVKGLMVNPTNPGIIVEHVLAAESDRSIILRFAHEGYYNVGQFRNSALYAVAITNDPTAYDTKEKAKVCTNGAGTQNLVVTQGGEDFPLKVMPLAFDVICNSEVFDSALFQTNVKYVNFKKTYTDANLSNCSNNHMMVTHPSASDATAGTYNTNVSCVNCDTEAYFNFMSPNPSWNGWFGGCGLFLCTGPENVLNVDFTGSLFKGTPSTGISHNDGIINNKCKKQTNWNDAYECTGTDYVQLEWESQAPDHNKRSTAPVYVTSLDGTYKNKINMFREWVWDGNEPMNLRENRYLATALVGTTYKIQYNGLNPYNLFHRIQQRTNDQVGEPDKWIIITYTYDVPMNIEISIDGGSIIDPYLVEDKVDLTKKTDICGANIYDWQTRTVQFVLNGKPDCLIRAVVLDTVRIHVKVVLKVEEFFSDTVKASFISKVASFLGISDFSRIKVVGANTQQNRFLQGANQSTSQPSFDLVIDITNKPNDSAPKDATAVHKDLSDKANKLKAALDSNTVPGLSPNTYFITSSEVMVATDTNGGVYGKTTNTDSPITQQSSSDSNNTLAIVLGVVIGLVVVAIAVVSYFAYKRYQKRKAITVQSAEIDHSVDQHAQEKETAKVHPLTLDPSNDQLQEKANNSAAPFQY